ncbi:hypothetical protein ISN45_Aa04g026070 [Arabidopsis thaliana x Arabidopsis arenosa]|uniref:DUF4283 domain-containing protein n=1 Tax=Arabidopsis thaliana x Arabidopsis arenosa TaxID=1240361 RepID=A0A8T2AD77_9BRAS|nr:hypothetical protein ISN45_Aa04g026070 [Arabidopsis thaliana x Arabidopsis arenosa]
MVLSKPPEAIGGASSPPDPRWPHLNRWSQGSPSMNSPPPATHLAAGVASSPISSSIPSSSFLAHVNAETHLHPPVSGLVKDNPQAIKASSPTNSAIPCSEVAHIGSLVPASYVNILTLASADPVPPSPVGLLASGSPLVDNISPQQWPSLSEVKLAKGKRLASVVEPTVGTPKALERSSPCLSDQRTRFPWAAKMNPLTRNLHRTTTPTFLEDGTPKVVIPDHVFLKGLENQKEFVLGQFYRCSAPPGGLINAVVNRIWGRKCRIFTRKLSDTTYLFHIPDESTRSWVLQRGLWHVDECLMFVASWSPAASFELPEISTVPVWVTLKNIPSQLYSIEGIKWIASGVGEPMLTNKPRLDPTLMGDAKIMVEVELDKPFAQKVAATDMKGLVSMVDVEYSWIPSKCLGCGHLGHKKSRCLSPPQQNKDTKIVDITPSKALNASFAGCASEVVTPLEASNPVSTSTDGESTVIAPASPAMPTPIPVSVTDVTINSEVILPIIETTEVISTVPSSLVVPVTNVAVCHVDAEAVTEALCTFGNANGMAGKMDSGILSEREESIVLAGNMFSRLGSSFSEGNSINSDTDSLDSEDSYDVLIGSMTPSGQRILRERPVQPSIKAQEVQASSNARGRHNRGRGPRGRGNRGSGRGRG